MVTATMKLRVLAPWKKNYDRSRLCRDITLPTKVRLVKAMVFPVAMYECESWTIKKAECQRIDDLELWCWRRLLRLPWTVKARILHIGYAALHIQKGDQTSQS